MTQICVRPHLLVDDGGLAEGVEGRVDLAAEVGQHHGDLGKEGPRGKAGIEDLLKGTRFLTTCSTNPKQKVFFSSCVRWSCLPEICVCACHGQSALLSQLTARDVAVS